MPLPAPDRLAHHEAGHAVVQHWVAKGRYRITSVSLQTQGAEVAGSSQIDRDVELGLYEYGLVVLAGIAAENRYYRDVPPPDGEVWGAVGDVDDWLATARDVLQSEARVDMVSRNVMKRLQDYFADDGNWGAVCSLASCLLELGTVEGRQLEAILERTADPA